MIWLSGTCRLLAFSRSIVTSGKIFLLALASSPNQVVSGLVDILKGVRALIQEFELKSAKRAETLHGGRFEGDHDRAGDPEQGAAESIDDGGGGVLAALALLVRLESQEGETGVGSCAAKAEAGDGEG